MSRFDPLYQHFEKYVGLMLAALPDINRKDLVFAYRDGLYRVYSLSTASHPQSVEINPAACLTSLREVWFFQDFGGLSAHVEYQPEYRPRIVLDDIRMPFIEFRSPDKPVVAGFTH